MKRTYSNLLKEIQTSIKKLVREKKENLYKDYFKLSSQCKIKRFPYFKTIRGHRYYYMDYYNEEGIPKSLYISLRKNKDFESKMKKIDKDIEQYEKELWKRLVMDLTKTLQQKITN